MHFKLHQKEKGGKLSDSPTHTKIEKQKKTKENPDSLLVQTSWREQEDYLKLRVERVHRPSFSVLLKGYRRQTDVLVWQFP